MTFWHGVLFSSSVWFVVCTICHGKGFMKALKIVKELLEEEVARRNENA